MKLIFSIIPVLLLASCATGYHHEGVFSGGGYKETKLSKDTYMVSYNSNGFTNSYTNTNHLLHRCAELTKENGFSYFKVMSSQDTTKSSVIPGQAITNTQSNMNFYGNRLGGSSFGSYSGYGFGNAHSTTTYIPPSTVTKPGALAVIKMSKKHIPGSYEAKTILAQFENKTKDR